MIRLYIETYSKKKYLGHLIFKLASLHNFGQKVKLKKMSDRQSLYNV